MPNKTGISIQKTGQAEWEKIKNEGTSLNARKGTQKSGNDPYIERYLPQNTGRSTLRPGGVKECSSRFQFCNETFNFWSFGKKCTYLFLIKMKFKLEF